MELTYKTSLIAVVFLLLSTMFLALVINPQLLGSTFQLVKVVSIFIQGYQVIEKYHTVC